MAKLVWDKTGERYYETGVNQGVLYPIQSDGKYTKGVAWNGLSAVTESPSGAEASAIYADNIKYLNLMSAEEFGATIEAYTYPEEFAECDGSAELAKGVYAGQQQRKVLVCVIEQSWVTMSCLMIMDTNCIWFMERWLRLLKRHMLRLMNSPEAIALSWEVTTTPVEITKALNGKKLKPTACLTIDSTKVDAKNLAALEDILYGTEEAEARLPLPDEVIEIMSKVNP